MAQPQLLDSSAAAKLWDVIIIGAGPAGATAAIHLARKGHSVLLLDKHRFPREKICGDGLIPDALACLQSMGLLRTISHHARKLSQTVVYSPSRYSVAIPGNYWTLKRNLLDSILCSEAILSGAVFEVADACRIDVKNENTTVVRLRKNNLSLRTKYCLVATGSNTSLLKKMGWQLHSGPSAYAARCYVRSPIALDALVASYDKSIAPGYAWLFPMNGNCFNIGCGIFFRHTPKPYPDLKKIFNTFISAFPVAEEIVRKGTFLSPLKGAFLRCGMTVTDSPVYKTVLAAGETIGTTFPFTGEGIGKAMKTGEMAATSIHAALRENDITRLNGYADAIREQLHPAYYGYRKAEQWLSRRWLNDLMMYRAGKSPLLRSLLAGIIEETIDPKSFFSLRTLLRSFWS